MPDENMNPSSYLLPSLVLLSDVGSHAMGRQPGHLLKSLKIIHVIEFGTECSAALIYLLLTEDYTA